MKVSEKTRWYVHRLRAMSLAEVCHRVMDRGLRATEGSFLKKMESAADLVAIHTDVPRLPEAIAAPLTLRSQLADDARRLLRGEWELFGWKQVEVGAPPCWHRDAACGVVIDPEIPARRLNHRHLRHGADARTIWEINRWAEMTRLAMHGWLNKDLAAVRTAQLWLEDWCERNPPGMGINWTSPLEAALRLLNFSWFDALVRAAAEQSPAAAEGVLKAQEDLVARIVPVHAAWVWRYRSVGSSANNHLLGELAAITVAVSRWPGLAKVTCTAEAAWKLLSVEILRQFAEDGGSREQALHYHLFAFELAWQAVRATGCRGGEAYDRLLTAAHFFNDMVHADEPWDFGDSDDAQVIPITLRRSKAEAEWQSWLQGETGALRFWLGDSPLRISLLKPQSGVVEWHVYPQSGMAICESDLWKLRLDASPLGFGEIAAHGHADALHLSVWDDNEALLIDPGTGGYFAAPELRAELAGWGAHNGPQAASGFRSPRRIGTFLQIQHHEMPTLTAEDSAPLVTLQHEGHVFRRLVKLVNGVIEVTDTEVHHLPFHVAWHLAPQCVVTPVVRGNFSHLHIARGAHRWELSFRGMTEISLGEARVSSAYGRPEVTTVVSVTSRSSLSTKLKRIS